MHAELESETVEYFPSRDVWVEEDDKVFLIGSRCPECGKHAFPAAEFCDRCGNSEGMEVARLSNTGTLYVFSEVQVAPRGSGLTAPYVIGYVDLPEGVRVFGHVENTGAELVPDDQVETVLGVIRTFDDGRQVISYKFRKKGGG